MLPDIKAFEWACKYINDSLLMPGFKWQSSDQTDVQKLDRYVKATK